MELEAAGVLVARLADGALELGAGSSCLLLAPQVLPLLPKRVRFSWEKREMSLDTCGNIDNNFSEFLTET